MIYDGNWLIGNNGSLGGSVGYADATPQRQELSTSDSNDGFGLNDYSSDTNYNGTGSDSFILPLPLPNSSVIRVGKMFNQNDGQGELSPIRRANVVTFKFKPTQQNSKIRVHYLGYLQEPSNMATYYSGALQQFRRVANNTNPDVIARNAASFGLFCRYDYFSNALNISTQTPSRTGRGEVGIVQPNANFTQFSNDSRYVDYGLNDMFCFSKAGTELRFLPNTPNSRDKKMLAWDSYILDFSEFVGSNEEVTITLFSSTSNYLGETQNHSYCYYQFECLTDTPTALPQSTLLDIQDINLGECLTQRPTNTNIKITNTIPTLLGTTTSTQTVKQINNGQTHKWLHLVDLSISQFYNNFATLKLLLKRINIDNSISWVNYSNIRENGIDNNLDPDRTDFRILNYPIPPTSIVSGLETYEFKVIYTTRNNPIPQEDLFKVTFKINTNPVLNETFSCDPTLANINATVNGSSVTGNQLVICKPQNGNLANPVVNLNAPEINCPEPIVYRWLKRNSNGDNPGDNWEVIDNSNTQNLSNAQNHVWHYSCFTEFIREVQVEKTSVDPCTGLTSTSSVFIPSTDIFTIRNRGVVNINSGSSAISIQDSNSGNITTIPDINHGLSNNINVCYGNAISINTNFTIGGVCIIPDELDANVSINLLVNNNPVNTLINSVLNLNNVNPINVSYAFNADNAAGLGINFSGVTSEVAIPVVIRLTITREGCTFTKDIGLFTIRLFPRAIGGSILIDPTCPTQVANDASAFTLTYVPGYTWQYCTNYTGTGTNATCNGTWATVPNQNGLDWQNPLAFLVANNINQSVIVRRVAQSGNNCGGAQNSNTIEINFPQEEPNFDLPSFFCEGAIGTTMPQANPAVSGTWHLMTAVGSGNTYAATPTTQLPANLTAGNYNYIFIPNTANATCFAPVVWNFNVFAPVDPGTLSGTTTLAPAETAQITATVAGGVWSSANTAVATVDSNGVVTAVSNGTTEIFYTLPGNCPTATSITITVVNCSATTTWNGTTWSNGIPNTPAFLNTAVVFNANFSTTQDLYACSVTVNNNAEVVVEHVGDEETNTGHTLTVKHEVTVTNGATLKFEDDTSLVQIEDDANFGNIIYERITPNIGTLDYVYWSSPVVGQMLNVFSPNTPSNRFYAWNPNTGLWFNTPSATTSMETGKGYIVRGPDGFLFLQPYTANFVGVPHNGLYTIPVINSTSTSNLIGNPYPSALDIDCFLADPVNAHLGGTIMLWSHNIPIDFSGVTPGTQAYNYNINSYVPYNRLGGVGSGITSVTMVDENGLDRFIFNTDRPRGKVAAGQSFFVKTATTGVATFKNSMRVGSQNQENSQFFRNPSLTPAEASVCVTEERHRLWIQIQNTTPTPHQFKQTLMGYAENATTGVTLDRDYDTETFVAEPYAINLYTLSPNNVPLTIQGRELTSPFDTSDVIPLGFTCKLQGTSGTNTIQIVPSEFDGLFETTDFWLRESLSGGVFAYHDIRTTPYSFTITTDIIDDTTRFAIVFSNPLPRQEQTKKDTFSVLVAPNPFEKGVTFDLITNDSAPIKVQVFDILGKLVEEGVYTVEDIKEQKFGTELSTGVYQAIITQGNQRDVQKIIKQ